MHLIRCATVAVADLNAACERYETYLDYHVCEQGVVPRSLTARWAADASAGAPYAVLQPASGRAVFLRFVEQTPHPRYAPLRTFGWNALELCVRDVASVAERLQASPFEIIGPPQSIPGLDAILPMQVRGPDQEIVYLTEIRDDLPEFRLPRADSLIDSLFILVMGCRDLDKSRDWLARYLRLDVGRERMIIPYRMISEAYGLPLDTEHVIATLAHDRDVFLEVDQYPQAATSRDAHPDALPPGISIGSFVHPEFDAIVAECEPFLLGRPQKIDSCVYDGRASITLRSPDGMLFEIVDAC